MSETLETVRELPVARDAAPITVTESGQHNVAEEINLQMQKRAMESLLAQLIAQARAEGNEQALGELTSALSQLTSANNYSAIRNAIGAANGAVVAIMGTAITGNQNSQILQSLGDPQIMGGDVLMSEITTEQAMGYYRNRFPEVSDDTLSMAVGVQTRIAPLPGITLKQAEPLVDSQTRALDADPEYRANTQTVLVAAPDVVAQAQRETEQDAEEQKAILNRLLARDDLSVVERRSFTRLLELAEATSPHDGMPGLVNPNVLGYLKSYEQAIEEGRDDQGRDRAQLANGIGVVAGFEAMRIRQAYNITFNTSLPEISRDSIRQRYGFEGEQLNDAAIAGIQAVTYDQFITASNLLSSGQRLSAEDRRAAEGVLVDYTMKYSGYLNMSMQAMSARIQEIEQQRQNGTLDPQVAQNLQVLCDRNAPMEDRIAVLTGRENLLGSATDNLNPEERARFYEHILSRVDEETRPGGQFPGGMQQFFSESARLQGAIMSATDATSRRAAVDQMNHFMNRVLMPEGIEWNTLTPDQQADYIQQAYTTPSAPKSEFRRSVGSMVADAFTESAIERALKTGLLGGRNDLSIDRIAMSEEDRAILRSIDTKNGGWFFGIMGDGADGRLSVDEIKLALEAAGVTLSAEVLRDGVTSDELVTALRSAPGRQDPSTGRTP